MSSRIDRYRPEELIGSAGVVDTFRVRVQETNAPAALKVLFSDRVEGTAARLIAQRFLVAGRQALASQVPGIARILEVSDSLETAFVATEFVPGLDLAELVRRAGGAGRVDPGLAGLLCGEVADTLARSHEHKPPLFHLGLCPGNVRVTAEGEVVVLDFGLAAALRTMRGCRQEKWDFVAPELVGIDATTMSAEAARAADVYSLGLLLCHLLGVRPGKLAPLGGAGISRGLLSAIRALTASEPTKRPDSVREVVEPLVGGRTSLEERRVRLAGGLERLGQGLGRPDSTPNPTASVKRRVKSTKVSPPVLHTPPRRSESVSKKAGPSLTGRGGADARSSEAPNTGGIQASGDAAADPAPARLAMQRAFQTRSETGGRRGIAHGARGRRIAKAIFLGGTVLAVVLLAWRLAGSRARSGQVPPADVVEKSVAKNSSRAMVEKINVETQTRWKDGGPRLVGEEGVTVGQAYLPDPDQPTPSRVPNHLSLDTHPSQADVWVDGVLRGKTPVDLVTGSGGHRVVVIKPGYQMLRAVYDTTQGEYARRELQRVGPPRLGNAFIDVKCATAYKYPVLIDDEETGHLCPASRLPVVSGKHTVGIFIPARVAQVAAEVNVPPGVTPTSVSLKE